MMHIHIYKFAKLRIRRKKPKFTFNVCIYSQLKKNCSLVCTQVAAPTEHQYRDNVKKLFQASASLPEGGEGSKMEEIVHTIMNNEFDFNTADDKGSLLLHEAIKVYGY